MEKSSMNKVYPTIMAGGTGSRLWPLSRETYPKQFIRLCGQYSMLQDTINRLDAIDNLGSPLIISNEEYRFVVAEQLREINQLSNNIILEPLGRNTAPAIALAALQIIKHDPNGILLVLAADHIINDDAAFCSTVNQAVTYAEQEKLVTFGVEPTYPETGYGYIKKGQQTGDKGFIVEKFVEKPNQKLAQEYLNTKDYLWNSGIFLFKASVYLEQLKLHRPNIFEKCQQAMHNTEQDKDFIRIDKEIFSQCKAESVDYAVMEQTNDAIVVPLNSDWSDVGSWSSLWQISEKGENNNVICGDVIAIDSKDNYLRSEDKLIATVGVNNLAIIETKDAVLVMDKAQSQNVKKVVDELKRSNRKEYVIHRQVFRPWGSYDSLDKGQRYHVKNIRVKPGEKLSLQMHYHRAEHWIVVSGTAEVVIDDKVQYITENQSVYIPLGAKHSLANPGKIDLEIIEVQSGSYLEEDDIVRFQDRYGRIENEHK